MPRYSWIKLQEHFFNEDNIVALESQKNGEKYVLLYLKLLLKSLKNKDGENYGVLKFSDTIPYTPELLSSVLRVDIDTVRVGIELFTKLGMLRVLKDGTMYVEAVQAMIGTESDSAERMRKFRDRVKQREIAAPVSQSDGSDVQSDTYIDIDKDINKDIKKERTGKSNRYVLRPSPKQEQSSEELTHEINPGHPDFLNRLLTLFQEAYQHEFGRPYIVVNPGRDRRMMAAVLKVAKAENPNLATGEMLTQMASLFASAMRVPDRWLRANMSPTLLSTKFNEIRSSVNGNGKNQLDPEKLARGYREVYGDLAGGGEEL